jgi:hypothetical protein
VLVWKPAGVSFHTSDPCWWHDEFNDYSLPGMYCSWCGAELGADGIARRNADTARVQRVREALDGFDKLKYLSDGTSHEICRAIDAIRAALDVEASNGE